MNRRSLFAAAALYTAMAATTIDGSPQGQAERAPQSPPPTFRVAVDLIAVDVQIVDREGRPVPGLGPDKFEVTINGSRRRVVSAELIASQAIGAAAPAAPAISVSALPAPPRIIVLAVDCLSFDAGAARSAMDAAREFIKRLNPGDMLGLFAYPSGPRIDPTTDRGAVIQALDSVVGQREPPTLNRFQLRPAEFIDLTASQAGGGTRTSATLDAIVRRECGEPVTDDCREQVSGDVMMEVSSTLPFLEGQANAGLGMFRSLLREMSSVEGRKTVVLVSGGMLASDTPGGRPDINDLGIQIGKEAARANTAIYTLYLDSVSLALNAAEARRGARSTSAPERDSTVLGRWLEQFSGSSGGMMFRVQTGRGEAAYDRILSEMSSYYLLGVEPSEADRDGRAHELRVKTSERNVTVRGRRWVVVPKRGATLTTAPATITPASPAAAPPPPPPPRIVPPQVQALADLFERGDYQTMQQRLAETADLANLLRALRASDSPWPDAPNRTAVFALEMAVAGLRSNNGYARDEGGRLLAEYGTRLRRPVGADAFECAWLWAEVAALEGLFMSDSAMLFVPRAAERCPREPRFRLAVAVLTEQKWLRASSGSEEEVMRHYDAAIAFPDTEMEARVRAASFLQRLGKSDRALAVLGAAPGTSADRHVRYLADLVRGQVLRSLGRSDDAAAAFEAALVTWPGAQSARVALMTLSVTRGDRQKAASLAHDTTTAADDQFDPWWTYWLGDYRAYPSIIARLRELAR